MRRRARRAELESSGLQTGGVLSLFCADLLYTSAPWRSIRTASVRLCDPTAQGPAGAPAFSPAAAQLCA